MHATQVTEWIQILTETAAKALRGWKRRNTISRWQARVEPHTGAAWVRDERSGAWARAGFARLRNPGVEGVLDDAIKERTAQLADSAPRFRRGEEGRWYKKVWLPARPAAAPR